MRSWRPVRDLRAYLFAAMHNVFIDTTRKRRSRADHVPIEDVMATLALPANQTRRLEVRDLLQALAVLPEQQREVVLLVGLEGMSYLEAARVLDDADRHHHVPSLPGTRGPAAADVARAGRAVRVVK